MPFSFLVFDFGTDEEAAQKARHRIEGWKQGFRLDKKLQLKFERKEPQTEPVDTSVPAKKAAATSKGKAKSKAKQKSAEESSAKPAAAIAEPAQIRLIVRLDFSDHEKLSHQRWVERIPTEEPFKTANPKIVRGGDPEFSATSERFDSLD
jgi:hypothetical protein